jgi:hypothetical protein
VRRTDVRTHADSCYHPRHPAVNVKAHDFGGPGLLDAIRAKFACPESVAEQAAEMAHECSCREFWGIDADDQDAGRILGHAVKVYQEGRSGGWLVVYGLPAIDTWNAVQLAKWQRFENTINAAVRDKCDRANILELIEANRWYITPTDATDPARAVVC